MQGLARPRILLLTGIAMAGSVILLALAMKTLPVGTAYAAWTGIGIAGTFVFGVMLLNEPVTPARLASVILIVVGIIGLKLSG